MGVLRGLLGLPVSGPLRGSLWVARKIHEAAETELLSPASIKRQLAVLEEDLIAGRISEDDFDAEEAVLLDRLMAAR